MLYTHPFVILAVAGIVILQICTIYVACNYCQSSKKDYGESSYLQETDYISETSYNPEDIAKEMDDVGKSLYDLARAEAMMRSLSPAASDYLDRERDRTRGFSNGSQLTTNMATTTTYAASDAGYGPMRSLDSTGPGEKKRGFIRVTSSTGDKNYSEDDEVREEIAEELDSEVFDISDVTLIVF